VIERLLRITEAAMKESQPAFQDLRFRPAAFFVDGRTQRKDAPMDAQWKKLQPGNPVRAEAAKMKPSKKF